MTLWRTGPTIMLVKMSLKLMVLIFIRIAFAHPPQKLVRGLRLSRSAVARDKCRISSGRDAEATSVEMLPGHLPLQTPQVRRCVPCLPRWVREVKELKDFPKVADGGATAAPTERDWHPPLHRGAGQAGDSFNNGRQEIVTRQVANARERAARRYVSQPTQSYDLLRVARSPSRPSVQPPRQINSCLTCAAKDRRQEPACNAYREYHPAQQGSSIKYRTGAALLTR
jgi:hypothetical protein